MEDAFSTWAERRQIIITEEVHSCIVDIKVRRASRWDDLPNTLEGGYTIIGHDLNDGADGDFIAIYTKLGASNDPSMPINKVFIQNTSDGESLGSATRIEVDLNDGAGGDYLYLAYTRGTDHPITGLVIEDSGSKWYSNGANSTHSYYWVMEGQTGSSRQDLNEDAGGNYIYLGYTYDKID